MEQTMLQNGLVEKLVFRCTCTVGVLNFPCCSPPKKNVSGTGKKDCSVSQGSGIGTS